MRKVGILPPLTYQMQNDGEIEPAHQAYQDYDPRPREFAGQRPRNSRGQRCDLCGLTHGTSFELITRICELIFRRKLRPSFPAQIAALVPGANCGPRSRIPNRVLV